MRVDRFHAHGFKSLADVAVNPKHFTVVVGANNAGKSNLGEAFDFIGEIHRHGLEIAINRKGGYENIAHRRMRRTKSPLSFSVEATIDLRELRALDSRLNRIGGPLAIRAKGAPAFRGDLKVEHEFTFRASGQSIGADFSIAEERLTVESFVEGAEGRVSLTRNQKGALRLESGGFDSSSPQGALFRGFDTTLSERLENSFGPTDLLIPRLSLFNQIVRHFERELGAIRLFRLTPLECRKPGVPTPSPVLGLHGGNLPALVAFLKANHPSAWEKTINAVRDIVPGLIDVDTGFTHDRQLTLKFVEEGVGRPWTSQEISDGTIQSLALIAAVFDPRSPLAFIEEPENAVHPWIVRNFVEACRQVDYKQIIVTTHSPALLNDVSPSEVLIVWRKDGRSQIEQLVNIDPKAEALWSENGLSTFELLDSGGIPEPIPPAFS